MSASFYRAAIILMMGLTTASYAQSGCSAVAKTSRLLYLRYDSSDKKQIWLTLRNNTTCAINVQTNNELTRFRELRLTDGSSKIEIRSSMSNHDFVDNEVTRDLIYELRDSQTDRMIKTTSNRHLIYLRRIPSGTSVRISVPLSSRKLGWKLAVPFSYDWEEEAAPSMRGGVAHEIYFSFPESR